MAHATHIMVITTCGSQSEAQRLASTIVGERLGACAQVEPVSSHYWWEGRVHHEPEYRVTVKTRASLYAALCAHIKANHSYSVPQIVKLTISGGSRAYLAWIDEVTCRPSRRRR
jgi:periplasmic divalent cation tolerance protein